MGMARVEKESASLSAKVLAEVGYATIVMLSVIGALQVFDWATTFLWPG